MLCNFIVICSPTLVSFTVSDAALTSRELVRINLALLSSALGMPGDQMCRRAYASY